jgi:hypothetical protein
MTAAAAEPEPPLPPSRADLGSATGGVWTRADALACGCTDDVVRGRLRAGYWLALRPGVYCDGGIAVSAGMRAWAAVLASGGPARAWADGRTTLRLHGLPLVDDDDPATGAAQAAHDDVAVLRTRAPRQLATLHRHRRRRPFEVGLVRGCPSVSVDEALVTAAGVLTHEALVCVLDAALHRGVLTVQRLDALVTRAGGRRHGAALRRAVAAADGRAESPAETLCRLLLLPHLPGLVPQVRVRDSAGRLVARLDLGDEQLRLAVEADGRAGHAGHRRAADDRHRDARTEALGWRTERCTWFELRCRQQRLVQRVLATAGRQQAARATSPG